MEKSYSSFLSYRADGGALYIEQTAKVIIQGGTSFKNLKGRYGGAIYIYQDRLTTTSLTKGLGYDQLRPYVITDAKFENCDAQFDGGAIYAKNPMKMRIIDSIFFNNNATEEGGALFYHCEPDPKELTINPDRPCYLSMEGDVLFSENSANIGGAIRWNLMEMVLEGDPLFVKSTDGVVTYGNLRFTNNQAGEYGPEIASVARELIKFSDVQTYLRYYNGTSQERQQLVPFQDRETFFNDYIYDGVQSGGNVPTIFLGLIDKYG